MGINSMTINVYVHNAYSQFLKYSEALKQDIIKDTVY